jgi:uncharacterized protein YggT (Ycf19 family)
MTLAYNGVLNNIVFYFFHILAAFILVRIILMWLPISPANPFVRFFANVTDPMLDPIARRLPKISAGMFNVSYTIAIIFMIWALLMLDSYVHMALPRNW